MANAHYANESGSETTKEVTKITWTIIRTEEWFQKNRADEIVRNLAFYRGKFWQGDGVSSRDRQVTQYRAQRNEVFPIVDTIVSALAMDLPQVEALDQRHQSPTIPNRDTDATFAGQRIASTMNWFADEDQWDVLVQDLVLHAELFDEGGIAKVTWSPALGRPIVRVKMPWEVHFDPAAKRMEDAAWAFERFTLHYDDFVKRIKSGVYDKPKMPIRPDTYPRTLIDEHTPWQDEVILRRQGLKDYVSLVEYWDYRKGFLYHLHPDTRQVLMKTKFPYGRSYVHLTFHSGVGRIRGIADVSLIAPIQRDINELVSARREIVSRLPRRMFIDKGLFRSAEEFERFKNSRAWEPTLIEPPPDMSISDRIYTTPEMPTGFDFNRHLEADIEHVKWVPGMGDYQRGEVKNIRTAAEANMVRAAIEGRLNIRVRKVVRAVTSLFNKTLESYRWAVRHEEESGVNLQYIWSQTQNSIALPDYRREIIEEAPKFRLLPFSPLMEDKIARRESLVNLLNSMSSTPMVEYFDWREIAREIQDLYGMRPSIVSAQPPEPEQPEQLALPGLEPPPGTTEALPTEQPGAPMIPPELLAALGETPS